MIKTWIQHGSFTALAGLLGLIAGGPSWAIAAAVWYGFREGEQHLKFGTKGFLQWLDRIMDAAVPVGVALVYTVLL